MMWLEKPGEILVCFRAAFLNLAITDILGQIPFCCGGCSVHCRVFCSILASTHQMPVVLPPPQLWQPKMSLGIASCSLWGQKSALFGNDCPRGVRIDVYLMEAREHWMRVGFQVHCQPCHLVKMLYYEFYMNLRPGCFNLRNQPDLLGLHPFHPKW